MRNRGCVYSFENHRPRLCAEGKRWTDRGRGRDGAMSFREETQCSHRLDKTCSDWGLEALWEQKRRDYYSDLCSNHEICVLCPPGFHSSLTSALIKLIKCSAPEIWRIYLRYGQSQTSKCIRSSFRSGIRNFKDKLQGLLNQVSFEPVLGYNIQIYNQ